MKFGLTEKEMEIVHGVFRQFPRIKKIIIFGSRAMGNFKKGSDIDLAIVGKAEDDLVTRISGILNEETTLPYKFDIVHYETISSIELKRHIDEQGKLFYNFAP